MHEQGSKLSNVYKEEFTLFCKFSIILIEYDFSDLVIWFHWSFSSIHSSLIQFQEGNQVTPFTLNYHWVDQFSIWGNYLTQCCCIVTNVGNMTTIMSIHPLLNPSLRYLVGPLRLELTLTDKLTGIVHINADVTTKMIATYAFIIETTELHTSTSKHNL